MSGVRDSTHTGITQLSVGFNDFKTLLD